MPARTPEHWTREPRLDRIVWRSRAVGLVTLLCLWQTVGLAQTQPQERKWGELAQIIEGHEIQLALPDGVTIKGEVVGVRNDTLIMNIKRSTNETLHPTGHASIPRASVTLIELERPRRGWRRNLGAKVGAIAGVALGAVAALSTDSAGAAAVTFAAVGSGGALIGYFVGRNLDSRRTPIKIVP